MRYRKENANVNIAQLFDELNNKVFKLIFSSSLNPAFFLQLFLDKNMDKKKIMSTRAEEYSYDDICDKE